MSADVELRIVLVEIATVLSKQDVEVLAFIYGLENCQDAMKLMDQLTKQQLITNSTKRLQVFIKALTSIGRVDLVENVERLQALKCSEKQPSQESSPIEQSMSKLSIGVCVKKSDQDPQFR